ncbi:MAG: hypothetical protein M1836_005234 [Candelina mexicana]|nr:MAG: hypothetical protein M1836_005234 [Candelina mexicana]
MDPISIMTIVGAAAKIIDSCAKTGFNLEQIKSRWKEAPAMLSSIGIECRTIEQLIKNIKRWLEQYEEELLTDNEEFLDALSSSLEHCLKTLQKLQEDIRKVSKWKQFKRSLFKDETLKECRDELRWHVTAATNLYSTFHRVPSERRRQAEQIKLSLQVHSSRTSLAGSSAGSILDDDTLYDESLDSTSRYTKYLPKWTTKVFRNFRRPQSMATPGSVSVLNWFWVSLILLLASIVLVNFFTGAGDIKGDIIDEASKHALFTAAGAGSPEDVARSLKLGVKPSIRNESNLWTPLHYAAASGSTKTIGILLKHKDTGWLAENDLTPLHLAAKYGHTAAVRQILELSGHDWDTERAMDQQAIEKIKTATQSKFHSQFETFLQRKTFTARELAAMYSHTNTIHAFRSHSEGNTLHALSCACMLGNVDMVETLWSQKTSQWFWHRSQVRWFPAPPLHLAVMSGSRATVAFLLERSLKATDQSTNYVTSFFTQAYPPYSSPAHYAAGVGSAEILIALERRRADLTALDYQRRTPLSYAVENLNVAAVELLVQRKYRKRSGWVFGSPVTNTYLGSGHVWPDKKHGAAAISNPRIVHALENIGFSTKSH